MDSKTAIPTTAQQKFMDANGVTHFTESFDGLIICYHTDEIYQRRSTLLPGGHVFAQERWVKSSGDLDANEGTSTAPETDEAKMDLASCHAILAATPQE